MKKLTIVFCLSLWVLIVYMPTHTATLSDLIQGIRDRSILFDDDRFPDSLLKRWANECQEEIAVGDTAIEKVTTIPLSIDTFIYALPSDFYLWQTVIMNANPEIPVGDNNVPYRLDYVPSDEYGASFSFGTGRPEQFSIWADSLRLNRASNTGYDTLTVYYYGHATDMLDGDSTMVLPDEYESILINTVVQKCYQRILMGAGGE